jgi:diguanylate cyclase (GGDEF)-like protein
MEDSVSVRPPIASGLSQYLAGLAEATTRLPHWQAAAIAFVALAVLGAADQATGPQVNLVVFYLLITCFAAWCLGAARGFLFGIITVLVAGTINGFHFGHQLPGQDGATGARVWNIFSRLMSTSVMVLLSTGLRGALDLERWRASTDGLTGVLNKAAFTAQMETAIARAQQRGSALVLAYIDLDGFKGVNDGYGHAAGDGVLRTFAASASDAIRSTDLFARIGGDEFVALLTVPDCGQGDGVAEMLHYRLARILRGTGYRVTCSMGALIMDSRDVTAPGRIIDVADRLMYEVKRSGKDALRVARGDLLGLALDEAYPPPPAAPIAREAMVDRPDRVHIARSAA